MIHYVTKLLDLWHGKRKQHPSRIDFERILFGAAEVDSFGSCQKT